MAKNGYWDDDCYTAAFPAENWACPNCGRLSEHKNVDGLCPICTPEAYKARIAIINDVAVEAAYWNGQHRG